MTLEYALLDVFADAPFQGTQIPVVKLPGTETSDASKMAIASEFQQTETVFIEPHKDVPACVFNSKGPQRFGAHTILAASYVAFEMGLTQDEGSFASFLLRQDEGLIESFIDKAEAGPGAIQFARVLSPTADRYTPEVSRLAAALNSDEKHISFSKYKPMVISVDRPTLIVPFTRPEHVIAASLNSERWAQLLGELYTSELFLFAPGSITGSTEFHGRLLNPNLPKEVFPPIGNVMPEFVAYLAEQQETAAGTHTFSIDRGSLETRKSILHAEFDKKPGKEVRCRIGGNVIKMGVGTLLHS
ncbi:PhzF family phenazine biosynthesis protein [Microbulbifer sp. CAU 1566]|uniref:PhzF family phenazine biosynthesis protein n=1 Tax=unclassified Microbulbifer TaxID=2619833 RepID=UPI0013590DBD|nr:MULTISPECIES: PhzF family phenazine biosynthesis protein [unclassified Microbulbifer]MCK7596395.1 PhzF family phenazine biosynthesis protein [Microbulbifer sp. CAU 1566]